MQWIIISYYESHNLLRFHGNYTLLYDVNNCVLLINEMQRLRLERQFQNFDNISNFNCNQIKDQLWLYICGESDIEENKVIYTIELEYFRLLQDSNLIITAPTTAVVDKIGSSTIYRNLFIGIKNKYNKSNPLANLKIT